MIPMYFGRSDAPLYGVYHAPVDFDSRQAAVFCYPFGQEYMRAHRAYRQLATRLTERGFHVLRFDYRGTGDSSGAMETVDANNWLEDVSDAIQELRDTAGVSMVSLVGLRLGALLAFNAGARRNDVDRVVLWDPISSGRQFETELLEEIRDTADDYVLPLGNFIGESGEIHYNGFTIPARFRESLQGLDLSAASAPGLKKIFHVVSHESEANSRIREAWKSHPGYHYQFTTAPHDWNYVDNVGGILLPHPVIQAITSWMSGQDK